MASAKLGFGPIASTYDEGKLAEVQYWMDQDYVNVRMDLLVLFPDGSGWDAYDVMLRTMEEQAGNHTFSGYKMRDAVPELKYAFWLSGEDKGTPSSGGDTTGYAALSDPFKIQNKPSTDSLSHAKLAGAAICGFVLCALIGGVMAFTLRRRWASQRNCVMLPSEYKDSGDSVMQDKERVRLAMGETSA